MEVGAKELEAVHLTFTRLEQRWMPPLPDASVWFGYDPLPIAIFLEGLRAALAHMKGDRFLDVGCGIGTKLALMCYLGWQVAGIDRHQPYLDAAAELVPSAALTCANAFEVECFDADLVYMYRPAVSEEREQELEAHVSDRMAKGSLLWLPCRPNSLRVI